MNRYPTWLNLLVLGILMLGLLLALPNVYDRAPAVQLSEVDGKPFDEAMIGQVEAVLEAEAITPKESFIQDGRVIVTFATEDDQLKSGNSLRERFSNVANVAFSSAPELPGWIRSLGLSPMSLGLDLRGGVYVLLEVDMDSAIESRLEAYGQDFADRLRNAGIRSRRAEPDGQLLVVRLNARDIDAARDIIREADPDLIITDGADGRSLRIRMSDTQIRARQVFAIDLLPMEPIDGVTILRADFSSNTGLAELSKLFAGRPVDLVMSDLAPNISGMRSVDQPRSMFLAELALDFARKVLVPGGVFVTKLFQGEGIEEFVRLARAEFKSVAIKKPKASRPRSREVYMLAREYRGLQE